MKYVALVKVSPNLFLLSCDQWLLILGFFSFIIESYNGLHIQNLANHVTQNIIDVSTNRTIFRVLFAAVGGDSIEIEKEGK